MSALDRAAIARWIPHAGAMVLLDDCVTWTDDAIHCRSGSHRDSTHPLRTRSGLLAVAATEIAAQAIALHASLRTHAAATPSSGVLASLREVRFARDRLDDVAGMLQIHAACLHADTQSLQYRFRVEMEEGSLVCDGRALLVLGAGDASDPLQRRPE